MTAGRTAAGPGYALALPPGWARLALAEHLDRQVDELLALATRDRSGIDTARLRTVLTAAVAQAASSGALAVYFPITHEAGAPVPVSFAVARAAADESDPVGVLLALATKDPSARAVELAGCLALRTSLERRGPVDLDGDRSDVLTRSVRYLIGVPGDSRRWLAAVLSVMLPDEPGAADLADAFTELFDALMLTFRWEEPDAADL